MSGAPQPLELLAGVVAMASEPLSLSPMSGSSGCAVPSCSEITAHSVPVERAKRPKTPAPKKTPRSIAKKETSSRRFSAHQRKAPRSMDSTASRKSTKLSAQDGGKHEAEKDVKLARKRSALVETEDEDEGLPTASMDSRRALRAERNRQSAAASRERKKRHLKDLESRVQYLSEVNARVQYQAHMERTQWAEREKQLERDIVQLRTMLTETREKLQAVLESSPHASDRQ